VVSSSIYLSFFFSLPNLTHRRLDVCHTCTHGVVLSNLGCRSETCCTRLAGDAGRKKSPKIRHLRTITQFCRTISSQLRRVSTIGKKLVKQQYLPRISLQYDELRSQRLRPFPYFGAPPANFNGSRVLAALLHGTLVVGVSQTLRC